jgi:hypothetical protein
VPIGRRWGRWLKRFPADVSAAKEELLRPLRANEAALGVLRTEEGAEPMELAEPRELRAALEAEKAELGTAEHGVVKRHQANLWSRPEVQLVNAPIPGLRIRSPG